MNEHKRVKHGQQPGDIPKHDKIAMREKKTPIEIFPWHTITEKAAKTYRNGLREKGKTVQRRRDKAVIKEQLDELT